MTGLWKVGVGAIIGVVIGATAFHPHAVSAQGPRVVHVVQVGGSMSVSGEVIGFSCVPVAPSEVRMSSPAGACYIATQ